MSNQFAYPRVNVNITPPSSVISIYDELNNLNYVRFSGDWLLLYMSLKRLFQGESTWTSTDDDFQTDIKNNSLDASSLRILERYNLQV